MTDFIPSSGWIVPIAVFLSALGASLHILLNMKDETSRASLWLIIVFFLPFFGALCYLIWGIPRRDTFGNRVSEALNRISNAQRSGTLNVLAAHNQALSAFISGEKSLEEEKSIHFRVLLDRIFPDYSPVAGNSAELLCDGDSAYPAMIRAIRSARKNINMQSFIISNDRIGADIFAALQEKAAEGVQIKVIYDSFGSFGAIATHFFRRYSHISPNLQIRAFSHASLFAPWRIQLRNHRKLLVVDGELAFIGGLNISAENFSFKRRQPEIHDLHCRLRGPAVGELQINFLKDWCIACKKDPNEVFTMDYLKEPRRCGNNSVRVIPSGHGFCFQGSEQCFFAAAATAKNYLWISTPYFVPDSPLLKALRIAALRGVDVRITVPARNNHFFMSLASRSLYETLIADGVRVFERGGNFSHAKALLVDGEWAMFGSSNCDIRSFRLNFELDMLISKGDFLLQLHEQMRKDFTISEEVSLERTEHQPLLVRLLQSLCALFSPIL